MSKLSTTSIARKTTKQCPTLSFGVLALVLLLGIVAVESAPDLSERFLLLATKKTKTMQKELDEAAAAGYQILVGSPTSGTEMALVLEKVATPPDNYQYLLLATTKTSTMQKELDEAAARGFRLLPNTMISKKRSFGGDEVVVVLEKAPNLATVYEYLLLATNRTSTLQTEMTEAVQDGYSVMGMVSRGEHMVILEKRSGSRE